jgi:Recombination endonuclease VII
LTKFGRNKARPDGLQDRCAPCHRAAIKQHYHTHPGAKERVKAYSTAWNKANPERRRLIGLRNKLKEKGLTMEQYDEAMLRQEDGCGICGSKEVRHSVHTRLHIDHDHSTGQFRGLLCHNCNVSLGLMRDDMTLLERAIAYLKAAKGRTA